MICFRVETDASKEENMLQSNIEDEIHEMHENFQENLAMVL